MRWRCERGRRGALLPLPGWRRSWAVLGGLVGCGPPCRESQPPPWGQGKAGPGRIPPASNRVDPHRVGQSRPEHGRHRPNRIGPARRRHHRESVQHRGTVGIGASRFVRHRIAVGVTRPSQPEPTRLVAYELRHVMQYSARCQVATGRFDPSKLALVWRASSGAAPYRAVRAVAAPCVRDRGRVRAVKSGRGSHRLACRA